MREINVSRAGDPVHVGDKALTRETPTQRGRVNRYVFTAQGVHFPAIFRVCVKKFYLSGQIIVDL